jgi:2-haloacid dehalogenase
LHFRSDHFEVLTFDCYGTLIDWETGILGALKSIFSAHGKFLSDIEILELYGEFEAEAEAARYQSYRAVLASVVRGFGEHLGFAPTSQEESSLADALPGWHPWPDTVTGLVRLQSQFPLAVISNIDDDLFSRTRRLLAAEFAYVITAQQAQCYKPGLEIFRHAITTIGIPAGQILHIGQSRYHDVRPAQALGIATVLVNRPSTRENVGAVRPAQAKPDLQVADLTSLADILLRDRTG